MNKKAQIISLILLAFLFEKPLFSQNFIGELNSGNFKNDGKVIMFRIKNITNEEFNALILKAKDNKSFAIADFKGYSEEYKIGSIYLTSSTNKTLSDLQDFCLFLDIKTVIFDNKTIESNTLANQRIKVIERNSKNIETIKLIEGNSNVKEPQIK